jgi:RNA polymerase-binding transcription factor DksA
MNYKCKNKECPSKGKAQTRIAVISACTQTLTLGTDDWDDLDVGETLYAICRECGEKIPPKTLAKLLPS